jgi:(1->4)-alpha-D-glucan 1-alpha-D-glucosylmutase
MAKGLEDTAFYRYNRLVSHNEVGGDPSSLSATLADFHAANGARQRISPHSMLATATHDTKRGEDVRARLAVLAECPDAWAAAVNEWRGALAAESDALGDRNLEYLLLQTLVGSWPMDRAADLADYRKRVHATLVKSAREARVHTSWARPDEGFEVRLARFVDAAFGSREVRRALDTLLDAVRDAGVRNSLVQTVLKLTVPGVPDLYQGTENWDLNLVDPDNRRPVDFASRVAALGPLLAEWKRSPATVAADTWAARRDGRIKLLTIAVLLRVRRERPELFASGAYRAWSAGDDEAAPGAFVRELGSDALCVVFERRPTRSTPRTVELPPEHSWRDLFTRAPVDGKIELGGPQAPPFAVLVNVRTEG